MAQKRHIELVDGYPLPGYNCPRCGSEELTLIGPFTSGQRVGVCKNCGENFIVEPNVVPTTVVVANPPTGPVIYNDQNEKTAGG
jgi:transcription elongation factor Elf1